MATRSLSRSISVHLNCRPCQRCLYLLVSGKLLRDNLVHGRPLPAAGPLQDPRVHQEVEHDAEGDGAHLHDHDHQY